jgi:Cu-Zn family superoxide dismutase
MAVAPGCDLQDTGPPPISAGVPASSMEREPTPAAQKHDLASDGVLKAADGHVVGHVSLRQVGDKVTMWVKVWGLAKGPHGLHIHDEGACAGPDFQSAGGPFNPDGARQAGDFGNLTVGKDGTGDLTIISDQITLRGGARSISGRSVLILGAADDLETRPTGSPGPRPTGSPGPRIACAVIATPAAR